MKIYTRTGDDGFTTRPGGQRLAKDDPLVKAIGVIDELNCLLGWSLAAGGAGESDIRPTLESVQGELFGLGALLAAAGTTYHPDVPFSEATVTEMERRIDAVTAELAPQHHFILPQGCELACRLHLARTACRAAERAVVGALDGESRIPGIVLKYLNRLSDFLFVLARLANARADVSDIFWESR